MKTVIDELKKLGQCVTARWETSFTFFEQMGSTPWEKRIVTDEKIPATVPYAASLIEGSGMDFVVESDGKEFPVHSLILKSVDMHSVLEMNFRSVHQEY